MIIEAVRSEKLGGHLSMALFQNRLECHARPPFFFSSEFFRHFLLLFLLLFPLQHPFPYRHWR